MIDHLMEHLAGAKIEYVIYCYHFTPMIVSSFASFDKFNESH